MSAKVEVRIERLIVEGRLLAGRDAAAIQRALERELGRLFAAGGMPAGWVRPQSVAAVSQESTLGTGPVGAASLGTALGQAIYRGTGT